jgi:fructuronate reductase
MSREHETDRPTLARLSLATLAGLKSPLQTPTRRASAVGVVHLGVGNFHRAHQAVAFDNAINSGDLRWGILGVSLRTTTMRDALRDQDFLYSLQTPRPEGEHAGAQYRVIGALSKILVASESLDTVLSSIARPEVSIVSLTVTEKGYGFRRMADAALSLELDDSQAPLQHDLSHPERPCTAIGLLHAALARRHAVGGAGLTVMSCDNLPSNGRVLRRLILQFSQATKSGAQSWIEQNVAFPNAMVDRIVPQTSAALRASVAEHLGAYDASPVATEAFSQWVLEDHFIGARPELEASGVQLVKDVAPFEAMKLRLLNAAHSCLAYLAFPANISTVTQSMRHGLLRQFIENFWHTEAIPAFPRGLQRQALDYVKPLVARFASPALAHQTYQIAMDGSQKIPLRWAPTVESNLLQGLPVEHLSLAVAAWLRYLSGHTERGQTYRVQDPLAKTLQDVVQGTKVPNVGMVASALQCIGFWTTTEPTLRHQFNSKVLHWLCLLHSEGSLGTLTTFRARG